MNCGSAISDTCASAIFPLDKELVDASTTPPTYTACAVLYGTVKEQNNFSYSTLFVKLSEESGNGPGRRARFEYARNITAIADLINPTDALLARAAVASRAF